MAPACVHLWHADTCGTLNTEYGTCMRPTYGTLTPVVHWTWHLHASHLWYSEHGTCMRPTCGTLNTEYGTCGTLDTEYQISCRGTQAAPRRDGAAGCCSWAAWNGTCVHGTCGTLDMAPLCITDTCGTMNMAHAGHANGGGV